MGRAEMTIDHPLDLHFADWEDAHHLSKDSPFDAFIGGFRAAHTWISVKNRLPDDWETVLIYLAHEREIFTTTFTEIMGFGSFEPTYWLPLPAPPENT